MHSRLKKIGLILSSIALLVTAVCLPLHHHPEEAAAPQSAHCDVCHFASKAKSVTPSLSFFAETFLDEGRIVSSTGPSYLPSLRPITSPPRAPPTALSS